MAEDKALQTAREWLREWRALTEGMTADDLLPPVAGPSAA